MIRHLIQANCIIELVLGHLVINVDMATLEAKKIRVEKPDQPSKTLTYRVNSESGVKKDTQDNITVKT